jgi:hypothetical protein
MGHIAPSLVLLWDVMWALEKGLSTSHGVQIFMRRPKCDVFYYQIETWWLARSHPTIVFNKLKLSITRRQLLEVLELGLNGESISSTLKSLENELLLSCEEEIQHRVALLPIKIMFPLFGLLFPSMLLLLLVPLMRMLNF